MVALLRGATPKAVRNKASSWEQLSTHRIIPCNSATPRDRRHTPFESSGAMSWKALDWATELDIDSSTAKFILLLLANKGGTLPDGTEAAAFCPRCSPQAASKRPAPSTRSEERR